MANWSAVQENNLLLASLSRKDGERFLAACEPVDLTFAEILAEPNELIRYVYFPTSSFVSLVSKIDGKDKLEMGLVGNEGMLGVTLILDFPEWPLLGLVQGEGAALRMATAPFLRELQQIPELRRVLQHYLFTVIEQVVQTAACAHYHVLESRLARCLLMSQDRAHSNQFHVTHEFLAYKLGVRRVGITAAAIALHKRNLIAYSRGDVTILDRSGLEAASCECYKADNATYARLMSGQYLAPEPDYRTPALAACTSAK